jgi:hypothetical protein
MSASKWLLRCFVLVLLVSAFSGAASAEEGVFSICARLAGPGPELPGASHLDLSLSAFPKGSFVGLVGQVSYQSTTTPPGSIIVYSVSGAASSTGEGWWLSLSGLGYDLARNPYRGEVAILLGSEPGSYTFTYSHEKLDGSAQLAKTGLLTFVACSNQ